MAKKYRIKELSGLTSVTVRTLHYYDEINLLKPSFKSYTGHRFYSETDMFRLQQITTLKFLGFSLGQIQQIIFNPQFNIQESLRTQAKIISEEAIRLELAAKLLRNLVDQLDKDENVNWNAIAKITEVIQMGEANKEKWLEKYLTPSELDEFNAVASSRSQEFWNDYHHRWKALYKEVEANFNQAPESKKGQELARKWMDLVDEVYPETSELRQKLWDATKAGLVSSEFLPSEEVIQYLIKAVNKLKRGSTKMNY